ncbi:MAG: hypothetical protein D6705_13175 [Deltaproteobacteria bacterium]|nr:MAG: hypothetical protein D6705_13175 [Deltaproteobacteria bacterium]
MSIDSPLSTSEGSGLADIQSIAKAMDAVNAGDSVDAGPVDDGAFVVSAAPTAAPIDLAQPSTSVGAPPFGAAPAAAAKPAASRRERSIWAGLAVSSIVLVAAVGVLGTWVWRHRTAEPADAPARLAAAVPGGPVGTTESRPARTRPRAAGVAAGLAGGLAGREADREAPPGEEDVMVLDELDDPEEARRVRSARRAGTPKSRESEAGSEPSAGASNEADGTADPFAAAGDVGRASADPFAGTEAAGAEGEAQGAASSAQAGDGAAAPTSPPSASGGDQDDVDVDCLVNRDLPKCASFRADARRAAASSKVTPDENLPEKLSMPDVRKALAPVKAAARTCGRTHGASPGTKVRVKLSIEGATGLVVSATPLDEHATSPLGRCVAAKFGDAKFPRFRSKRMGLTFPIVL